MELKRITIRVSGDEHQKLRVLVAQCKTTIQEIAHELLRRWIAEQEQDTPDA